MMISKSLKYYSKMVCKIMLPAGIDQNIIYEDYDAHVQKPTHILRELSFLHMNNTRVPHEEMLGLMNPLSKRSFNFSFSSLSSAGAILYGRIDIGLVSGRRSMPKSISLLKGIPERSSRKRSEHSRITGTDSRLGVSELVSLTRTR
ncbi:hypothetical protein BC332_13774 [Capsicum chinense]|nr:hypothetical protein BC332_13774 [Capsicum chinense]